MGPWTTPHTRVMVLSVEAVTVRSMGTSRPVGSGDRLKRTAKNALGLGAGLTFFQMCLFVPKFLHAPEDHLFHSIQLFLRAVAVQHVFFFFSFSGKFMVTVIHFHNTGTAHSKVGAERARLWREWRQDCAKCNAHSSIAITANWGKMCLTLNVVEKIKCLYVLSVLCNHRHYGNLRSSTRVWKRFYWQDENKSKPKKIRVKQADISGGR